MMPAPPSFSRTLNCGECHVSLITTRFMRSAVTAEAGVCCDGDARHVRRALARRTRPQHGAA